MTAVMGYEVRGQGHMRHIRKVFEVVWFEV